MSARQAFGALPVVVATRGMLGRTSQDAEVAMNSAIRAVDDTMEKRHGFLSNARARVGGLSAQATAAFQLLPIPAAPYGEIMASVHAGGLLSVARGFHWVGEGKVKRLKWTRPRTQLLPLDIEGSWPTTNTAVCRYYDRSGSDG
jgi:hypothetical protein